MNTINQRIPGSFRDPSGFVFRKNGLIYRQVNPIYRKDYDHLMQSGLYEALIKNCLLIPHEEMEPTSIGIEGAYKILKPERIPFISYPYEWCFSQLKEAALTTIRIQKIALDFKMSLKDGSAFNIQFKEGKPIFMDTLSFERFPEGKPWIAYRQFCQHFIAPLALMADKDVRINQWLKIYLDGIPLDLAGLLLSWRTFFKFSWLTHIHMHARGLKYLSQRSVKKKDHPVSHQGFLGILDSLESSVRKTKWNPSGTEWGDYYDQTNYTSAGFQHKQETVGLYLEKIKPDMIWDLGANTGLFSRLSARKGVFTVSFDIDPAAVEKNFLQCREERESHILPLILDVTNPSPAIGWENQERMSLLERGPADTVLALSLIHHLAISNNLPLDRIAGFFAKICKRLIVEFIPKEDSYAQRLLSSRRDIFPEYQQSHFEYEFKKNFEIRDLVKIRDSKRTLYLMFNKGL